MVNIADKEYELLTDYILKNYGIKLGNQKKSLVVGRLQNVLLQKNFSSFSEYYDYVVSDKTGDAVAALVDKITTNHTFFMREPGHFYYFRDNVLPYLASTIKNKDLRIWSAGCSTGEEAYTLAMIMQDYFGTEKPLWDTRVLATDISSKVLETAKKGEYRNKDIEAIPLHWRTNYFTKIDNEKSVIADKIKNEVIFRSFNLMNSSFPFKKKFHVIFCRNVMIYFDAQTKKELVGRFYDFMEPGGFLFIGHSESLNREETRLKYVMPAVYRKE
ncbi:MAG: protein-glutamate O-methyltransferase CheR [Clostridiales bacterium]|jgi:chemotaxis protein methyltransferase CheR|nr:protein-glutamate O-methyltransferase CheR [Eubacteriales bacterium]MDH7567629.1 protein-glutamate O-methyltransferase CheR [Clostridiales bacterium]